MTSSSWRQFLTNHGAEWDDIGVIRFSDPSMATHSAKRQLIDLSSWGVLAVEGPEARKFLQGQVTCDMNGVNAEQYQRGAHCNIKGQAIFSFYTLQLPSDSEKFILIMPAPILKIAKEQLAKFIVFSKASIAVVDEFQIFGLLGDIELHHGAFGSDYGYTLNLPMERTLFLVQTEKAESTWNQLSETFSFAGYPAWNLAAIRAGYGDINIDTSGKFIPQLLNFHLTEGINFKKGCYLGQEVVARMEYKGNLKRHMRRAQLIAPIAPVSGEALYGESGEQSIGNIISAVQIGSDSFECLAIVTDKAFEDDQVYLKRQNSSKLQFLPLPYAITK